MEKIEYDYMHTMMFRMEQMIEALEKHNELMASQNALIDRIINHFEGKQEELKNGKLFK